MRDVYTYADYFEVPESHSGILDKRVTTMSVSLYGLGHLGSWIARALAALGVRDMILHDFDIVEERNLSGSIYDRENIGIEKTEAAETIIERESLMSHADVKLGVISRKSLGYATTDDILGFVYQPFADFYILATDNPESRIDIAKLIFKQWNMCGHATSFSSITPVLVDTRSNGASLTVMNIPIRDREMQERYMLDLEELARGTGRISCDAANIIQVPLYVASIVSQMVSSFVKGKEAYYVYHGSLLDLGRFPFRCELNEFLPSLKKEQ